MSVSVLSYADTEGLPFIPSQLAVARWTSLEEILDDDPDLEAAINSYLHSERE